MARLVSTTGKRYGYSAEVPVETIEDLRQISVATKHQALILTWDDDGSLTVEIYDGYRE